MDVPHRYEMSLKKDGLFINLSSDDVYFVSKQMDKWFRILLDDSYVPVSLVRPESNAHSATTEQAASAVAPEVPAVEPVVLPPAEPVAAIPTPEPVPVVDAPPGVPPEPLTRVEQSGPVAEAVEAVPATVSVTPLETPTPIVAAESNPLPEPIPALPEPPSPESPKLAAESPPSPALSVVPPLSAPASASLAPKDDFESVMDTVMRDLEAPPPPLPVGPPVQPFYEEAVPVAAGHPMNLDLVNSLADLCDQAQPGNSEDYLMLAAYYLSQVESLSRFSLKRINANLVKSGLTPVNHSTLEAVLSKGYLSMVPDLSGTAEVSEYSMTDEGLAFMDQLF